MKQTAVEWLVEQLKENNMLTFDEWTELVEQAKAMEKEQIIESHIEGFYSPPFRKSRKAEAEQYYNETFKSE
jgi:hypothetical protein